jgi:hypothetical protein
MKDCEIKVHVLMHSGTTQQYLTWNFDIKEMWTSDSGYYCIKTKDDKLNFFPIINTIIEQI